MRFKIHYLLSLPNIFWDCKECFNMRYTVIRSVWVSTKFGTCTVVSVNGTLVEAKMWTFTLESTHFIFNKCPIYTHNGAKFSTNLQGMGYSVVQAQKQCSQNQNQNHLFPSTDTIHILYLFHDKNTWHMAFNSDKGKNCEDKNCEYKNCRWQARVLHCKGRWYQVLSNYNEHLHGSYLTNS